MHRRRFSKGWRLASRHHGHVDQEKTRPYNSKQLLPLVALCKSLRCKSFGLPPSLCVLRRTRTHAHRKKHGYCYQISMARERQCWSAKESTIRRKKLSELQNDMFLQPQRSHNHGMAALRLLTGGKIRRKKTVQDLERGWINNCTQDVSKQRKSTWYGFRDKGVRMDRTNEEGRVHVVEGWASNIREQKAKELHQAYGTNSTAPSPSKTSVDRRVEAISKKERRGTNYGRSSAVTASELHKAKAGIEKRMESPHSYCNSGKSTYRSTTCASISRPARSPSEIPKQERYLDGVWIRSPKGAEAQADVSSSGRGLRDFEGYFSRQEREKEMMADSGWMSTSRRSSPRRDSFGHSRERAKTADDIIKAREDKFRETSWFSAFQSGQRREMYGLRSYSIGDYLTKKVHKDAEDLSWAANCRARPKSQTTSAA